MPLGRKYLNRQFLELKNGEQIHFRISSSVRRGLWVIYGKGSRAFKVERCFSFSGEWDWGRLGTSHHRVAGALGSVL